VAGWRRKARRRHEQGVREPSHPIREPSHPIREPSHPIRRIQARARSYLHLMSLLLQVEQRGGARISRLHRGSQDALVRIFDSLLHVLDRISIGIATRTGAILLGATTLGGLA